MAIVLPYCLGDASVTVASTGPYTWSSPQLVADVQSWVDNAGSNFGWFVVGNESASQTVMKFGSKKMRPWQVAPPS